MANFFKKTGLSVLCGLLEWQVVRLRKKQTFVLIAVAGSLGKTSTKIAISKLLELSGKKIRYQTGNYNVRLTVPLVVFNQELPGLFNIIAWAKVIIANEKSINKPFPDDFVVVELGTDAPGQIREFAYLKPDLGVITAIAPEHMENFANLDAVAKEEFMLADYAKKLLLNLDDIDEKYLPSREYFTYGASRTADYCVSSKGPTEKGQGISINKPGKIEFVNAEVAYLGVQGMKILAGAVATVDILGLSKKQITHALHDLQPFSGRMQRLHGINDTILIDDTYNAAPASVLAALDVLDSIAAPQHIAILGSMNELGDFTEEAHTIVAKELSPEKIDLLVTIGKDAEYYIAKKAKENGCEVVSFLSPYDAGIFVSKNIKPGAVVLAKGSQNWVFAEEALKPLLKNPEDSKKLVRQSEYWLSVKRKQFPKVA